MRESRVTNGTMAGRYRAPCCGMVKRPCHTSVLERRLCVSVTAAQECTELCMDSDRFPLRRIDHLRFFVGNARQSAYFYRNAFGFDIIAYAGLETGSRDEAGYV